MSKKYFDCLEMAQDNDQAEACDELLTVEDFDEYLPPEPVERSIWDTTDFEGGYDGDYEDDWDYEEEDELFGYPGDDFPW